MSENGQPLRLEYIDVEQLADNPSNWRQLLFMVDLMITEK